MIRSFFLLFTILLVFSCKPEEAKTSTWQVTGAIAKEFYQIKCYTFDSQEQIESTDTFLKNAYLPSLRRLGIEHIGVFKTRPEATDSIAKTYVLVPFTSLEQFNHLEANLLKDSLYTATGADYLDARYDKPPFKRIETILLKAFKDFPKMRPSKLNGPRAERIYELRSYESATEAIFSNKVKMFNQGGEVILFDRLDFNAVFYAEVLIGPKMPNLMYMTTFSDQVSRDAHWKEFVDSPEWQKLITLDEYKNNISHIDISFLYPTEYSDY